jgi:hypothetical protein
MLDTIPNFGSSALSVLNKSKGMEFPLVSSKTKSFWAYKGKFLPLNRACVSHHRLPTTAEHGKCGRSRILCNGAN